MSTSSDPGVMSGALEGVSVLDFSRSIAGPYAATALADFGAEVVSVEPPGGAGQRRMVKGAVRANVMRNRRSLVLDLKSDGASEVVADLVGAADVVIHNYRPAVAERLGVDYDTLSGHNEGLVVCSVTGFGEGGPYSGRPATDPIAQAMSGLMWNTGEPDRKPSRVGASPIDVATGMYTAFAALAALRHRDRTGEGQRVETSLFDTAAAFMGYWYTYHSRTGDQPSRQGDSWGGYAPAGIFGTADGPVYVSVMYRHLWERFCDLLDREAWLSDPRFATDDDRTANREALTAAIEAAFAEYTGEELVDALVGAGIPASELQTVAEAAADEHLRERGTVERVEDADGREVLTAAAPARLSATDPTVDEGPPATGEHTREVLRERGFTETEVRALLDRGVVGEGGDERVGEDDGNGG
jgi:crotonobetainyl-CoA:carnitine CoA-transferase CaiB-like acyl-CoA transferase